MNKMNKEDLLSKTHPRLTMGDLRRFVENSTKISDQAPVVCERIKDVYFEKHNWGVLLEEGEIYYNAKAMNINMDEEILYRKKTGKRNYPKIENPEDYKSILTDDLKNQYFESWCITKDKDNSIVYICNHY